MGQGLPEVDASVFGSPQVGMLMEEKPPPSLRAACGLPPAGGEPRVGDVAAVPARSGGASFAAGGRLFVISISNPWPAHPPLSRQGDVPPRQQETQSPSRSPGRHPGL